MKKAVTEADFQDLSWHDCTLWGLAIRAGDPEENDWTRQLVLDIDFIVEWLDKAGKLDFLVAPATLTFEEVNNLHVQVDFEEIEGVNTLNEISMDRIERKKHGSQCIGKPCYSWTIHLNGPKGLIRFDASGFTQVLESDPVSNGNRQSLSLSKREAMKKKIDRLKEM
ncbi:MAG TPA: hypothetical protein PLI09_05215 [Candidatus Hydrogenedentes bacterium]|nr:hypothetical protein [Candidatus Hydrogenedentota bacterium]